jgi:hypothetical protein
MKLKGRFAMVIGSASLLLMGGCPSSRTSDNGGGSLLSAAVKVGNSQITGLTEDEIQIVTDFAIQQSGQNVTPLDNATADAVKAFIVDNHLNSIADVQAAIKLAQTTPNAIVVSDDVRVALEGFVKANEANFGGVANGQK